MCSADGCVEDQEDQEGSDEEDIKEDEQEDGQTDENEVQVNHKSHHQHTLEINKWGYMI